MEPFERLTSPENLYWAWGKVRRYYRTTDAWFNEAELAAFESNLETELSKIREQFRSKTYRTSPLLPLPQPKAPDNEGEPRARQAFWVSIADQVAWITLVNVIGPQLEAEMPIWSYGNRLYRPAWLEDSTSHPVLKIGPFRNSPGLLYRKFPHCWPLYRRHIFLTIRQMSLRKYWKEMPLAEADTRVLAAEEGLEDFNRLPYLTPGFWKRQIKTPFWASLDLEKFYPKVNLACIKDNIREHCANAPELCGTMLDDLLRFRLDLAGWSPAELKKIDLDLGEDTYAHIPTGLMAAGFLANVAMLKIDRDVGERVQGAQVAHFRYVDDHVVLAQSFDALERWVAQYELLIADHRIGTTFNAKKFEPKQFGTYYLARSNSEDKADVPKLRKEAILICGLDAKFPVPLMTKTLGKISEVGRTDFNLLDDREQEAALSDLEHLLVTEFPDTELPAPTRVAFAATKIAFLAASREQPVARMAELMRERFHLVRRLADVTERLRICARRSSLAEQLLHERKSISVRVGTLSSNILLLQQKSSEANQQERSRVFALLVKAVREYPEKLRLWERVLEFCRVAGNSRLGPLMEELYRQVQINPLASRLLRAHVLRIFARQMLRCAHLIKSDEYPPFQRAAAGHFMISILNWARRLFQRKDPKYYELESELLCRVAAGTCIEILTDVSGNGYFTERQFQVVREKARALGALNWREAPERWTLQSHHSLVTWTWWAEGATQSPLATSPGPIWQIMANRLDPQDEAAWSLWSWYPESVPGSAREEILRADTPPSRRDAGWLLDFASTVSPLELRSSASQRLRSLPLQDVEGHLNLKAWSLQTEGMCRENPFDPRAGEWTALRIVQQALEAAIGSGGEQPLHWSTVLVPESWTQYDGQLLRWDQWQNAVRNFPATLRVPASDEESQEVQNILHQAGTDVEFGRVQEAGLLLLGLLRQNFRWPAAWRSPGILADVGWVTRATIQEAHASSWTMGILEACLLPRQRENVLLNLLFFGEARWDDDTTDDPPPIFTLQLLVRYVTRAIEVLEKGQITVRDHRPRQLIPLRVEQISRAEWGVDNDTAGLQQEEDDQ
jgi:hypothetical protein